MYRILVVDDESVEREGIRFLIQKYHIRLEVQLIEDGKQALDYLLHNHVDILLTDIKMPFMDGLELAKNALEVNPDLRIIIFSAYSDFSYAKLAITLGVSDYLLKPINTDEFQKVIHKVISDIDSQKKKQQKEHELEIRYEQSAGYRKEQIVFSLVNGVPKKHFPENDLKFLEHYTRMMLLESSSFFEKYDGQLRRELNQMLHCPCEYFNIDESQSVLFLKDYHPTNEDAFELGNLIYTTVSQKFKNEFHIVISSELKDSTELAEKFSAFEQLLELRCFSKGTYVFCEWKNLVDVNAMSGSVSDILEDVKYYVKMKDTFSLNQCMELLCRGLRYKNDISHLYVKYVFSDTLKNIFESFPSLDRELFDQEIKKIYMANDIDTILDVMKRNIGRLDQNSCEKRNANKEIETVKTYIYQNYDKPLSLHSLAATVYLTPSYLCYTFKKNTGYNLTQFIKMYRMEMAKNFLQTSNMKIGMVAEKIGYTSVSYFCQSFREYWGESPEKFRQSGKSEAEPLC